LLDKKNLEGIHAAGSRTDDSEHTTASLGHSEVLSIENSPCGDSPRPQHSTSVCPLSPWREKGVVFADERPEEVAVGVLLVREDAGDVLPEGDDRSLSTSGSDGVDGINDLHEGTGELAAWVGKTFAKTGDREGLARCAAHEDVRSGHLARKDAGRERGHVAEVGHGRVVVLEHGLGKRLDLAKPQRLPAERVPRAARCLNA
jgi:hypothetical protein